MSEPVAATEAPAEVLDETPDANDLWEGIAGHFDSLTQVIAEFVDNAVANFTRPEVTTRQITMRFTEASPDLVGVVVEDTGTGIDDLRVAFRLGDRSKQDSPLSAHGFGLKHALATANRANDGWSVSTRTSDDLTAGRFRRVSAPYGFSLDVFHREGSSWPGEHNGTGTVIEFTTSRALFDSISKGTPGKPGFSKTLEYLQEDLGFIYADLIKGGQMLVSIRDGSSTIPVAAVEPNWVDHYEQGKGETTIVVDGHALEIEYEFGEIGPSKWLRHYGRNQRSAGVELRLNGRVIDSGLFTEVWGLEKHPSYNHLLVKLNLNGTDKNELPKTRSSKNGFHEGDPLLLGVFDWIRSLMPTPPKELTDFVGEKELVERLADTFSKLFDDTAMAVEPEFIVYQDTGSPPRADLYFFDGHKRKVYEAKKKRADVKDLYQLVMYWDGMVHDGIPPSEGILVASEFADGVQTIIDQFNGRNDASGNPYNFSKKTWKDLTVDFPPRRPHIFAQGTLGGGEAGIRVLLDAFAHDVRIEHPLSLDVEHADRGILELSDEQFRVLDARRRAARRGLGPGRLGQDAARGRGRHAGSRPKGSRCC
jgi:hypothetical protein